MNTHTTLFQALSDRSRLRIVEAMRSGECAVGDIVERMDIHQSGVSRHLRILAEAGVVQMRPDGQKRLYSLRKEAFDQLEAWGTGYRRHWEARLDRFGAALERKRGAAKTQSRGKSRRPLQPLTQGPRFRCHEPTPPRSMRPGRSGPPSPASNPGGGRRGST